MRGYSRHIYYVWQQIEKLPAEEKEIATNWRDLTVQVNEARMGGLTEGYLIGAITFAAAWVILGIAGTLNDQLLVVALVLSVVLGLIAGVWIHRKKYVSKTDQAVKDVKAKLADPVYHKWWNERMKEYDHEGYWIIASVANASE